MKPTDLFDALPDAAIAVGRSRRIVAANLAAADLLGEDTQAVVGKALESFFPARIRHAIDDAFQRVGAEGATPLMGRVITVPVIRGDGEEIEVEMLVGPPDDEGHVVASLRPRRWRGLVTSDLVELVTSDAPLEDVLEGLLARLGTSLEWDIGTIWLPVRGREPETLRCAAVWERRPGAHRPFVQATRELEQAAGETIVGEVWSSRQPTWSFAVDDDPRFERAAAAAEGGVVSGLLFPLTAGLRRVAVLEFFASDARDADLWLASEATAVGVELGLLLDRRLAQEVVNLERAQVALALEAGRLGVWSWSSTTGEVEWDDATHRIFGLEPGRFGGTMEQYTSLVHPDDRDEVEQRITAAREGGPPLELVHRVVLADGAVRDVECHGRLVRDPAGRPTGLTGVVVDVTERERLQQQLKREARIVELLLRVSRQVSSRIEMEEVAQAVAQLGLDLTRARMCAFFVTGLAREDDGGELAVAAGIGGGEIPDLPPGLQRLVDDAVAGAGPFRVDDLGDDGEWPGGGTPLRSAVVAPVRGAAPEVAGALAFAHPRAEAFDADDARIAAGIAAQAGITLTSATRYDRERRVAQRLQASLLPDTPPEIKGIEICTRYMPGGDGIDVGGDFFDVLDLTDRVGLVVGDVRGHGLEAAVAMGHLRHGLSTLLRTGIGPERALQTLNDTARSELRTTATLLFVEIELASGRAEAWSAGHLPPVVVRSRRAAEILDVEGHGGPMLGVFEHIRVGPAQVTLGPGDVLALYTDGLIERQGEALDEGIGRLMEHIDPAAGLIDDVCDSAIARTLAAAPADHDDDRVLVAVRRTDDQVG